MESALSHPASLIFTTSKKGIFRKLIAYFTRSPGESKTIATHVAAGTHRDTVIEALWDVTETEIQQWKNSHKNFEVWINTNWDDENKVNISKEMLSKIGRPYGVVKLVLIALDLSLFKLLHKEVFLFRSLMFTDKFPICNWLYAYSVYNVLGYKFGRDPKYTDPDQMRDFCSSSSDWKMIMKVVE